MAYEDFTTYTEVDSGTRISKTANHIDFNASRTEIDYVYYDKGVGHFEDFEHLVSFTADYSGADNAALAYAWAVSTGIGDVYHLRAGSEKVLGVNAYKTTDIADLRLYAFKATAVTDSDDSANLSDATQYWLTIERSGTTVTCKIYSNSARTVLVETLTITAWTDTLRYIYGCSSYDTGNALDITLDIDDLDLQEGGETLTPSDTAKASDAIIFDVTTPFADDANASDSFIPAVIIPFTDDASASDLFAPKVELSISDDANASDSISFYQFVAHIIGDTAKAVDSLITAVTHPFADDANASDSAIPAATYPIADDANASDSFGEKLFHAVADTAKAADLFAYKVIHFATDIAKAFDARIESIFHPFSDTAKASDSFASDSPLPPYPCETFTLYGISTDILFPKPEWGNPNNSISKSSSLFNFWSENISAIDNGIDAQPLTIGGTVFVHAEGANWTNLAAITTWLDSIKTAMNSSEEFTINELGDCLNGVYVIKDFIFDTIVGVTNAWGWSLVLERVRDV